MLVTTILSYSLITDYLDEDTLVGDKYGKENTVTFYANCCLRKCQALLLDILLKFIANI